MNTFKLINKAGKETLVKFHWYPEGGAEFMTDEQAMAVGEKNMRHRLLPLLAQGRAKSNSAHARAEARL